MPAWVIPAITAGAAAISAGGSAYSAFNQPGPAKPDYKGSYHYNRQMMDYQAQRQWTDRAHQAANFGDYARMMGVSRYALLGNAPQAGNYTFGQPMMEGPEPDKGAAFAKMGQDIQRGVNAYMGVKAQTAQVKNIEANTELLNAQTEAVKNQTQKPVEGPGGIKESNLPSDYATYDQQLKDRGVALGEQPTLMRSGYLRMFPGEQIQDIVSEDAAAKVSYYYDKLDYALRLSKDRSFRAQQKAELEWRTGRQLYFRKHKVPWTGQVIGFWSIYPQAARGPRVIRKKIRGQY